MELSGFRNYMGIFKNKNPKILRDTFYSQFLQILLSMEFAAEFLCNISEGSWLAWEELSFDSVLKS